MRYCVFVSLACLLTVASAAAQPRAEPFEWLQVRAAAHHSIAAAGLGGAWRPARLAGGLGVLTPFHRGCLWAELDAAPFSPRTSAVPAFRIVHASLGWSLAARPAARTTLEGGVVLGAAVMRFDPHPDHPGASLTEFEVAPGGQARLEIALGGGWHADVRVVHRRVLTADPLRLTHVGLGLGYRFATPPGLRAWLR